MGAVDSVAVRGSARVPVTTSSSSSRADSVNSEVAGPPAPTFTFDVVVPKPRSWTSTVYSPRGRPPMEYAPSAPVTVVWVAPVASFLTVTLAPGTAAPEESRTTPVTRPSPVWAKAGVAATAAIKMSEIARVQRMDASCSMLPGQPCDGSGASVLEVPGAGVKRAGHAGVGPTPGQAGDSRELVLSGAGW